MMMNNSAESTSSRTQSATLVEEDNDFVYLSSSFTFFHSHRRNKSTCRNVTINNIDGAF
jgi:hypothetical protein